MPSTLESDTILELKNLNLVHHIPYHKEQTLREMFISGIQDPINFLFPQKDRLHVLKDLNINIRSGDRIALMGLNGSGKTTLCQCMAGMLIPNSGTIQTNGRVKAIFDTGLGIKPVLSGRENATLLGKFLFGRRPDQKELIEDALEFSELGHFLDAPIRTYSKGMLTRLSLSLISAIPHDILILDEVFTGADIHFSEKVEKRVLKMIDQSGAVIFVSHSKSQVKRACNRGVLLHQGNVIFDGSVEETLEHFNSIPLGSTGFHA